MGRPAHDAESDTTKALAAIDEGRGTRVEIKTEKDAEDVRASLPVTTETVDDVDELLAALTRDPNECECGDSRCDDLCGPVERDGTVARHYARNHIRGAVGVVCRHAQFCPADLHYSERRYRPTVVPTGPVGPTGGTDLDVLIQDVGELLDRLDD